MNQPVIPPSPSADDYAFQLAANADDTIFNRDEPIGLFIEWLEEAKRSEVNDANAMALATVDASGLPNVRLTIRPRLTASRGRPVRADPRCRRIRRAGRRSTMTGAWGLRGMDDAVPVASRLGALCRQAVASAQPVAFALGSHCRDRDPSLEPP